MCHRTTTVCYMFLFPSSFPIDRNPLLRRKMLIPDITNQKLSFDIFTVGYLQNIFMEHDLNILMIFVIKEKWIILTHTMYCCLLLKNIPVLLMTAFVLQGHILILDHV